MNDLMPQEFSNELSTAVYRWYSFKPNSEIAYMGENMHICAMFKEMEGIHLTEFNIENTGLPGIELNTIFDYIVIDANCFEKQSDPVTFLRNCRNMLSDEGILLLSTHNRLGIRYFCGYRDPYTNRVFDGIDNYSFADWYGKNSNNGRTFDKQEVVDIICNGGLKAANSYSVMPGLENPSLIVSEDFQTTGIHLNEVDLLCDQTDTVFLDEVKLYDSLLKNDMFSKMANAFLFECIKVEHSDLLEVSDALKISNTIKRGREKAFITITHRNKTISKKVAYPEGKNCLLDIDRNMQKLKVRGISIVEGIIKDGEYVMPDIEAISGEIFLRGLLQTDRNLFISKMDEYREIIRKSSAGYSRDYFSYDKNTKKSVYILKNAYLDMMPSNCLYIDGKFVFCGQEICMKDVPADQILEKAIYEIYNSVNEYSVLVDQQEIFDRYNISSGNNDNSYVEIPVNLSSPGNRINETLISKNRRRLNCSIYDFHRMFKMFIGNKKIVLFGAGIYALKFIAEYGDYLDIAYAIDNNFEKWGEYISLNRNNNSCRKSVKVISPDFLNTVDNEMYQVIVCIKNNDDVLHQLQEIKGLNYMVYYPAKYL